MDRYGHASRGSWSCSDDPSPRHPRPHRALARLDRVQLEACLSLQSIILAILLAAPAFTAEPTPETHEDRHTRLWILSTEIAAASRTQPGVAPYEVAAALLTLGKLESGWAAYVGNGECASGPRGMRCDPDKRTGVPRARSYWQVHVGACPQAWREEPGSLEELRAAARCAARHWSGARLRCRGRHPSGDDAGAFSGYRSNTCDWPGGTYRAREYTRMLAALRAGRTP